MMNINKVVIFFILFVSHQGFCPDINDFTSLNNYIKGEFKNN